MGATAIADRVRPFRFGVRAHTAPSAAAWRDLARRAEAAGYSALVVSDHFGDQFAPIPALVAAASATSALRVGTQVLDNDFRHPVVAAKELATVDALSGGRLEWGMGAGWLPSDYERSGITFDPPPTRLSRLQEAVAVMKGLFGAEPMHFSGSHFQVRGLTGHPATVQKPHPPLLIGGANPRLLAFAGRAADIVGIGPHLSTRQFGSWSATTAVAEGMDRQVEWIRAAAGARINQLELSVTAEPARVTERPRQLATRVSERLGLKPDEVMASPHVLLGAESQICETLEVRRERWGVSYLVVAAAVLDEFAPVVARLSGR